MDDLSTIPTGELLRRYRSDAELTQEELAERAGLSARAIRALEAGARRSPRRDTLRLLAEALGLAPDERDRLERSIRQQRRTVAPESQVQRTLLPLVGRQAEWQMLANNLREGAPRLTLLTGDPGIGKSRLLEAITEHATSQGWTILSGGCHRQSAQQPYAPLVDALARYLATRSPTRQRADAHGCAWLVRLLPELARWTPEPSSTWPLPPEQERRLMFMAVAQFLENVAGASGALLILDDLHWAGVDALDLLAFLVRESTGQRLRVIGAYRDTDIAPTDPLAILLADLAREGHLTQVPLGPLASDDAALLLAELLGSPDAAGLTSEGQAKILLRAGGVPFYLVTCAQEAQVRAQSLLDGQFSVPQTAAQSIRQRVALLDELTADILAIAAVAGRAIPRNTMLLVAAGLGHGEQSALKALEAATRSHMLVERADGSYVFAHDLIQETLETEIGGARRAALHRRIGAALARLPRPERRAAELAWHFAQGDDLARAIPYALWAGDHAEEIYAHTEAERHYHTAADWARIIGDQTHEAEALEKVADVLFHFARYHEAYDCLEQAIKLYRVEKNWERLAWATCQIARAGEPMHKTAESLERLEQLFLLLASAVPFSEGEANTVAPGAGTAEATLSRAARVDALLTAKTSARVYLCLMTRHLFLGHYSHVFEPSERTIHYARLAGDLRIESLAYSFRAEAQLAQGQVTMAIASLALGRERAEASGDAEAIYIAHEGMVNVHESQARPAEARAVLEQMLEISQRMGNVGYIGDTLCALGAFSFLLGEWDVARAYLTDARDSVRHNEFNRLRTRDSVLAILNLLQSNHDASSMIAGLDDTSGDGGDVWVWTTSALAERDILAGRADAAATRLRATIHRLEAEPGTKCYLLAPLAWAESELGEHAKARATLAEARLTAGALENRMAQVDIERVEALLAMREQRWEAAREAVEQSLAICRGMPYPYAEAKARLIYGDLCATRGAGEEAREHYAQALLICERLDEREYRTRIAEAITKLP